MIPTARLNFSIPKCVPVPIPVEPNLSWPGFDLAWWNQHNHVGADSGPTPLLEHRRSMSVRQLQVENDHLVIERSGHFVGVLCIRDRIDNKTLALEPTFQFGAESSGTFNDE